MPAHIRLNYCSIHRGRNFIIAIFTCGLGHIGLAADFFTPVEAIHTGSIASAVATGDLNHDGRTDVAIVTTQFADPENDSKTQIFLQNSQGKLTLAAKYPGGTGESVAVADVNGDGLDDVIVPTQFGLAVLTQNQGHTLNSAITYSDSNSALRVAVGDFNHDGLNDVAALSWGSNQVSVFLQQSDHTLGSARHYEALHAGYDDLKVGDVTGDGLDDIVVMSGELYAVPNFSVLVQKATGDFEDAVGHSLGGDFITHAIAIGPIDSDSGNGVAISTWATSAEIAYFKQNSQSQLVRDSDLNAQSAYAMQFGDVDQDGLKDLIGAGPDNNIQVLLRQAAGGFASPVTVTLPYSLPLNPHGLALGDVDGDGKTDIVMAGHDSGLLVLHSLKSTSPKPSPADRSAPRVRVSGGNRQHTKFPFVILHGTAFDNRKVRRVEVRSVDRDYRRASGTLPTWYSLLDLKPGRNTFFVRAIDNAGNRSRPRRVVVISD